MQEYKVILQVEVTSVFLSDVTHALKEVITRKEANKQERKKKSATPGSPEQVVSNIPETAMLICTVNYLCSVFHHWFGISQQCKYGLMGTGAILKV